MRSLLGGGAAQPACEYANAFQLCISCSVGWCLQTPGGKRISQESWQALVKTQIHSSSSAAQRAGTSNPGVEYDQRLREARGWYESAYEWRIVSYAMHTQAKLDAHDAGQVLFYVPAVDRPAIRIRKEDYDEMRGEPNIGATGKCQGFSRSSSAWRSS